MVKNLITLLFAFTIVASASWELDFDDDYASASTGTPDVLDGLVAWYKMDEASWDGTIGEVIDSSTNSIKGTSFRATTVADGKIGRCGYFSGNNEHISCYVNSVFQKPATVSLWIKQTGYVIDDGDFFRNTLYGYDGVYHAILISTETKKPRYYYFDGSLRFWDGTSDIISNQWHHVVSVSTASYSEMFIDSVSQGTNSLTLFNNTGSNQIFYIGKFESGHNYSFIGYIDDFRIYNRALSSNEVATIYNKFK